MPDADLVIAGGTVVSPTGRRRLNVAVADGVVTYVGPDRPGARETVDASGLLVMPGGVDTHVHLMDPGSTEREDFPTGTSAAAASGVTTIVEHSHGTPVRSVEDLRGKLDHLQERANVDFGLAAHAWPGRGRPGGGRCGGPGVSFFKVFTCTTHGVPGHDAAALKAHLEAAALSGAVSLMHCEDESLTESAEELLHAAGARRTTACSLDWRNRDAELVAAAVAGLLVRRTGARATVAHVSNPEVAVLPRCRASPRRYRSRPRAARSTSCSARTRSTSTVRSASSPHRPGHAPTRTSGRCGDLLRRRGADAHVDRPRPVDPRAEARRATSGTCTSGCPASTAPWRCCSTRRPGDTSPTRTSSVSTARPRHGPTGCGRGRGAWPPGPTPTSSWSTRTRGARCPTRPCCPRPAGRRSTAARSPGRSCRTYLRGRLVAEEGKPTDARAGAFLPGAGHRG